MRGALLILCAMAVLGAAPPAGSEARDPRAFQPAATISPAWKKFWPIVVHQQAEIVPPGPTDLAAWHNQQVAFERTMEPLVNGLMKSPRFVIRPITLGGVPALDITPKNLTHADQRLIYVHGGAFTSMSARSSLFESTLMAAATGRRVIAIDYTLAPGAKWQQVTDQVVAAYRALVQDHVRPEKIGMWGDSAGGSIVAGSVLKLRDKRLPMPGGVVLWSPWADVSGEGDTYQTLAAFDPLLTRDALAASALAYADPVDQKHPYVSPVYADFGRGFPPTLIQGGTRDIFLSNMVRLYQALLGANVPATLDLYEGMIHVFQPMAPGSPESTRALEQNKRFWDRVLR